MDCPAGGTFLTRKPLHEILHLPLPEEEIFRLAAAVPEPLVGWYRQNARDLPWRREPTPYRVWVSEIMLQQTRVEAVKPYYRRFLEALPDIPALAAAPEEQLLKLWEGLGYYSRARNLQKAARQIMERYGGEMPPSYELLLGLAGFGEYTAGAVASIAFGVPVPAVDGNVLRVFSRLLAAESDVLAPAVRKGYRQLLLAAMPQDRPGDYNQALMELGATLCAPNGPPRCGECPLARLCRGYAGGNPGAFPVKSAKKERRVEEKTVFVAACPEGVLLRRRPDGGLLGGLWEFPWAEGRLSREEAAAALAGWGIASKALRALRPAKHLFTHIEWRMDGFLALCGEISPPEGTALARWEELEAGYALPSAFAAFKKAALAAKEEFA